MTALDHVAISP